MKKKSIIIPVVVLVALLASVGGVFAYDGARPQEVAKGITVGGIDIGGLSPTQARAKLEREFVASMERPVRVHHDKATWTLGPKEAKVRANVDAVLSDALERSDEGNVVTRTMRRATGGEVKADLQPAVSYSDKAVIRLIDRVRRDVGRKAKDAKLEITGAGLKLQDGRRGLAVQASELHEQISTALAQPTGERRFVAQTRKVAPKVGKDDLAKKNAVVLIADRSANSLRLYKNLKLVKTYGVAAGQAAWPTPAGEFTIANKAVNPTWSVPTSSWAGSLGGSVVPGGSPQNPLKARWLGITDGVGIHGTSDDGSIGSNASHGCLRMHVPDVIDLYPRVPVGSRILIV